MQAFLLSVAVINFPFNMSSQTTAHKELIEEDKELKNTVHKGLIEENKELKNTAHKELIEEEKELKTQHTKS